MSIQNQTFTPHTRPDAPEVEAEYFTPPDEFRLRDLNINLSVWNTYFKPFDLIDAAIVSFIMQMCAAHRESIHRWQADGHTWTRIHPAHIKKGLPILKIGSNRSIQRRIAAILSWDAIGTGAILERRLWDSQSIPAYRPTAAADILTWVMPESSITTPERIEARARYREKLKNCIISPYTASGKPAGGQHTEKNASDWHQTSANDESTHTPPPAPVTAAHARQRAKKATEDKAAEDTWREKINQQQKEQEKLTNRKTGRKIGVFPSSFLAPCDFKFIPPDFEVAPCESNVAQYHAYKGVHGFKEHEENKERELINLDKVLSGVNWLTG